VIEAGAEPLRVRLRGSAIYRLELNVERVIDALITGQAPQQGQTGQQAPSLEFLGHVTDVAAVSGPVCRDSSG
jgi:hypothetical protein